VNNQEYQELRDCVIYLAEVLKKGTINKPIPSLLRRVLGDTPINLSNVIGETLKEQIES